MRERERECLLEIQLCLQRPRAIEKNRARIIHNSMTEHWMRWKRLKRSRWQSRRFRSLVVHHWSKSQLPMSMKNKYSSNKNCHTSQLKTVKIEQNRLEYVWNKNGTLLTFVTKSGASPGNGSLLLFIEPRCWTKWPSHSVSVCVCVRWVYWLASAFSLPRAAT